jgi:hypothetical protein
VPALRLAAAKALLAAALATAAGCGRSHPVTLECQRDEQCAGGLVCASGTCLPLAAPSPEWIAEVEPLSESDAGLLELTSLPVPMMFETTGKVRLDATVSPEMGAPPLTSAHVVLSVPARNPGRPDLHFETELVAPRGATTDATFMLEVPESAMGRDATVRLIPTGTDVAAHAPVTLAVKVDPTLSLILPSKSFTVRGRLFLAVGDPKVGQVVRAFQGNELVSTVDVTAADGTFALSIPASRAGANAPQPVVVVELSPPAGAAEPRLVSNPFTLTADVDLGSLRLPAFSQPNVFRLVVRALGDSKVPIAGAIVSARTQLADDASGVTTFQRQGTTNDQGEVDLALLPGSTSALRSYDIAVFPPTDSPYATFCKPLPIQLGSGGTIQMPAIVMAGGLRRRTLVGRTVHSSDDTPAAGVMVLVTRTATDEDIPCSADILTRTPTATTDASGSLSLYLDPGSYRFDYTPPAGAPWPPFSEELTLMATTTTTSTMDSKAFPAAAAADGFVRDAMGQPLPGAAVRLYEKPACATPACMAAPPPPALRAAARTDAAGHFRAIFAPP